MSSKKGSVLGFMLLGFFCLWLAGCGGSSSGPTVPAAPTGVTAAPASGTSATITWQAVTGATSYNIYYSTSSTVAPGSGTEITGVTSPYNVPNLTNGDTYYFVVTAVNAVGESAPSATASASLSPPAAPTITNVTPGNTQATITWSPVAGATSYNVYYATTSGQEQTANGTEITGVTSPYNVPNLTNGNTYYFVVTAVNAVGESAPSAEASASLTPPVVPTGVTATPGNGQVAISWAAVAGAASYNVYYATTSGQEQTANGTEITGVTSPYNVPNLTNGTTYYFVVTAVNVFGESAASSEVSAIPVLPAPTGVTATPGNGQATISWSAVTNATSYNIYYATTSGQEQTVNGTEITGVTSPYNVPNLTNGNTYYFVVTTVGTGGESAPSAEVSAVPAATPPPAAPTGVTATPGNTVATIAWTAVTGATSYNVYYATTSGQEQTANGTKITGVTSPYNVPNLTNGTAYYFVVTAVGTGGESTPSSEVSATPSTAPYINAIVLSVASGGNYFKWLQQVEIYSDSTKSTPILTATVTVNGQALTGNGTGKYYGNFVIAAGATVNLSVEIGGTFYTASGTQYTSYPTVISPASGTLTAANSNTFTWSGGAPTANSSYAFALVTSNANLIYPSSNTGPLAFPTSQTSYTIPGGSVAAGTYYLLVGIGTQSNGNYWGTGTGGISIANTAPGSALWIGGINSYVTYTFQ
jgi:fibronectin type 3 domain-containing protein